jgi:hypothetical protein
MAASLRVTSFRWFMLHVGGGRLSARLPAILIIDQEPSVTAFAVPFVFSTLKASEFIPDAFRVNFWMSAFHLGFEIRNEHAGIRPKEGVYCFADRSTWRASLGRFLDSDGRGRTDNRFGQVRHPPSVGHHHFKGMLRSAQYGFAHRRAALIEAAGTKFLDRGHDKSAKLVICLGGHIGHDGDDV